mmetsp:Transcript_7904/g.19224  ORF Transcript_7904/g.19224 Transcript_7904/m.19224 type:complete len:210 (-) Transcript_7904:720-1349(-)
MLVDLEELEALLGARVEDGRGSRRVVDGRVGVRIEVARVCRMPHLGHDGRRDGAAEQAVPVDALEVLVLHHVAPAALEVPEALGAVGLEELLDEVLGLRIEVPQDLHLAEEDLLVDPEGVLVIEGGVPGEHLVHEDAKGPPVDRLAMPLALDDLRRKVLRRPTQGPRPVRDHLRKPEVGDFEVALVVEEKVLRLEVPVNDVVLVEVVQR